MNVFFDGLKYLINSIPWLAFLGWMGLLIAESIRANSRISEVAIRFDPKAEFVKKRDFGMGFASNSYWVDRLHHSCTAEFLNEWDRVYGGHWRRVVFGFLLLPIVGGGSQFLRYVLRQII
jgi:hypothetical protein